MYHTPYTAYRITSKKNSDYVSIIAELQHQDYPGLYGALNIRAPLSPRQPTHIQCINLEYAPHTNLSDHMQHHRALYRFVPYHRSTNRVYTIAPNIYPWTMPDSYENLQQIVQHILSHLDHAIPLPTTNRIHYGMSARLSACHNPYNSIDLSPEHWAQEKTTNINDYHHITHIQQHQQKIELHQKTRFSHRYEICIPQTIMFPISRSTTTNNQPLSDITPTTTLSPGFALYIYEHHDNPMVFVQQALSSPSNLIQKLMNIHAEFPYHRLKWGKTISNNTTQPTNIQYNNHIIVNQDTLEQLRAHRYTATKINEKQNKSNQTHQASDVILMPNFTGIEKYIKIYHRSQHPSNTDLSQHALVHAMRRVQTILQHNTIHA